MLSLGSYVNTVVPGKNLIKEFEKIEKAKNPLCNYDIVRKIAIEAPAATVLKINNTEITMPSTGILEFDYGIIEIYNLVFDEAVQVNIIYMY